MWFSKTPQQKLDKAREEFAKFENQKQKKLDKKKTKHDEQEQLASTSDDEYEKLGWWKKRKVRNAREKVEHRAQKLAFMEELGGTHQIERLRKLTGNSYDETSKGYAPDLTVPTTQMDEETVKNQSTEKYGAQHQQRTELAGLIFDVAGGLGAMAPKYAKTLNNTVSGLANAPGWLKSATGGVESWIQNPMVANSFAGVGGGIHAIGGIMEAIGSGTRAHRSDKMGDTDAAAQGGLQTGANILSTLQGITQMGTQLDKVTSVMGNTLPQMASAAGELNKIVPGLGIAMGAVKMAGGIAGTVGATRSVKGAEKLLQDQRIASGYDSSGEEAQNDYETAELLRRGAKKRQVGAGFDIATGALDTVSSALTLSGAGGAAGGVLTGISAAGKLGKFVTNKAMESHYKGATMDKLLQSGEMSSFSGDTERFSKLTDKQKRKYLARAAGSKDVDQLYDRIKIGQAIRLFDDLQTGEPSEQTKAVLKAMGFRNEKKWANIDIQALAEKLGFSGGNWAEVMNDPEQLERLKLARSVIKAEQGVRQQQFEEQARAREERQRNPQQVDFEEMFRLANEIARKKQGA